MLKYKYIDVVALKKEEILKGGDRKNMAELKENPKVVETSESEKEHLKLTKEHITYICDRNKEECQPIQVWLTKLSDNLFMTKGDVEEVVKEMNMSIIEISHSGMCITIK